MTLRTRRGKIYEIHGGKAPEMVRGGRGSPAGGHAGAHQGGAEIEAEGISDRLYLDGHRARAKKTRERRSEEAAAIAAWWRHVAKPGRRRAPENDPKARKNDTPATCLIAGHWRGPPLRGATCQRVVWAQPSSACRWRLNGRRGWNGRAPVR